MNSFRRKLRNALRAPALGLLVLLCAAPVGAAEQMLQLEKGWNLVSLQLSPSDPSPTAVFDSLIREGSLRGVWAFDTKARAWSSFDPTVPGPLNTLVAVKPCRGLWVETAAGAALTVRGSERTGVAGLALERGANLVAWGSLTESKSLAGGLGPYVTDVFGHDHSSDQLVSYAQGAGPLTELEPGKGYWLVASEAAFLPFAALPSLAVDRGEIRLTDGEAVDLMVTNSGQGELRWTAAAAVPWLLSGRNRLTDVPLSNSGAAHGVEPGVSAAVPIAASAAGLRPGTYEGVLTVMSNGGVADVVVRLDVVTPNLSGLWVGAFEPRPGSGMGYPGIALAFTQEGEALTAAIDARRAPAFATSIRKQAGQVVFTAAEGSASKGRLSVVRVPASAPAETWTFIALDSEIFAVEGSLSGTLEPARVGEALLAAGGELEILIEPSTNGRPYHAGDTFTFEVSSRGHADGMLTGTLEEGISGSFPLSTELHGTPEGVVRTLKLHAFEIDESGRLRALWEMRHQGLLLDKDVEQSGSVTLWREP